MGHVDGCMQHQAYRNHIPLASLYKSAKERRVPQSASWYLPFLGDFSQEILCHDSVSALVFTHRNKSFYDFWIKYFWCTWKIILLYYIFPTFFISLYQLNFGKISQKRHKLKHIAFTLVAVEQESCNPCCLAFLHRKFLKPVK